MLFDAQRSFNVNILVEYDVPTEVHFHPVVEHWLDPQPVIASLVLNTELLDVCIRLLIGILSNELNPRVQHIAPCSELELAVVPHCRQS